MIGYVRNFDGNRTMSFKISDNKLLKKSIIKYERELKNY